MKTFWFHLYPDINKPIGGVKQIHRSAEIIQSLGHRSFLVQDDPNFHPGWFESKVQTISRREWSSLELDPSSNIAVFAETFILALANLRRGLPVIVFNQNFAYSFGLQGQKQFDPNAVLQIYKSDFVRQVWCVSDYDRNSLVNIGINASKVFKISNCIDVLPFPMGCQKSRQICFMPRKNSLESNIVVSLLKTRPKLQSWEILPITKCSHDQVIHILQTSLIFLSFGHPEGFGLPVAEALISGCSVVGFTGLGGRELFDIAAQYQMAWPIEFGDHSSFITYVDLCIETFLSNKADYIARSREVSELLYSKYSYDAMRESFSDCMNCL